MPRWLSILIQIIGLATSGTALLSDLLPPSIAVPVVMVVSAAQAAIGTIAHSYNPDGTNAKAPYIKK